MTTAVAVRVAVEPGMYRLPSGDIFKVQVSRQSGYPYAKHLRPIGGARLLEASGERVHFEFVYAPGAIHAIHPEHALTLAEAVEFGIRYGVCCVCGAFLKDAASVERGIGPVCRKSLRGAAPPVVVAVAPDPEPEEDPEAVLARQEAQEEYEALLDSRAVARQEGYVRRLHVHGGHRHEYLFSRYCGARVCGCGDHKGLARCFCGWSASGGDGRRELIEMGETIEPEDY